MPSAKKYKDIIRQPSEEEIIKWLLHRRKPEQGGGRGGKVRTFIRLLFLHPQGERQEQPSPILPLTNLVLTPYCVRVCVHTLWLSVYMSSPSVPPSL